MAMKAKTRSDKISAMSHDYDFQYQTGGWRPSYLRRRVLVVFVVIFCIIISALEALNQISQAQNGIASSTQNRHYFWTYGPTAILTVVASFWSRVEFQAKQNAPWYSMLQGPQPADKSVLLDYLSEMQRVSIWRALKNKDFIVAAGVTSSILLRLLVIFSTGLFSLQEVQVQRSNIPAQIIRTNFNAQNATLDHLGAQAYDILNGVMFENLSYPDGSTAKLAFQEFSASELPSDANITVSIQGLMAALSCGVAGVSVKGWADPLGLICRVGLTTPSCNISNVSVALAGYNTPVVSDMLERYCDNTNSSDGNRVVTTMLDVDFNGKNEDEIKKSKDYSDSKVFNHTLRRSLR